MSMEQAGPRPEDTAAAMELINSNELLSKDPYAKRVVESGVADNGQVIDIGNFLAARQAFLEQRKAEVQLAASERKDRTSYDAAVISSVAPELESAWEQEAA